MATDKQVKRPRAPVVRIQDWHRVTCWLTTDQLYKLELAVIERRRDTGKPVEHGDIIGTLLMEKYSGLYLGDRRSAPLAPALDSSAEPAAGAA